MKVCSKCNNTKNISEFYVIKAKHDYYCKTCRIGQSLKSHQKDKAKKCTYFECNQPHYGLNLCRVHYARVIRNGSPERLSNIGAQDRWEYNLGYKYSLTPDEFNDMAKDGCNICGIKITITGRRLQVDHDHTHKGFPVPKEYIRGVVCQRCNVLLGKHDVGVLRSDNPMKQVVLDYVGRYAKR